METTTIVRGQFSTGAKAKGNFTGWDALGEQIYIQKSMMKDLFNIDTQAEWLKLTDKPVIYAIYKKNAKFMLTDDKGEPLLDDKGEQKSITQEARATAIFKDPTTLAKALNSKHALLIEIKKDLEETVSKSGLSDESIKVILSTSSLG